MAQQLAADASNTLYTFSRSASHLSGANVISHSIDTDDEHSIQHAAQSIVGPLDQIIVTTGMLHDDEIMPEKSLKELSREKFEQLYVTNTIGPALVAKHFLPLLHRDKPAVFAAISARVGSISDNYLGGWYAYRASKAALNMVIKNISIEMARTHSQAVIVGLHPGTVDSNLSKPFQSHVPEGKLFRPEQSASYLIHVLDKLNMDDSGKCFAWDGAEIEP
ncbi:MAG: SDR family NAD(P)-dependent oxidoreductase [Rickettsiales bacterium]|nr:SDR family NAD(P)-dependent oxidoreductase [Rickettsiales bacterium]